MWDWDSGEFVLIRTNNIVEAIHHAWNYEFDTYEVNTGDLVFCCQEDNEANSELLGKYGLRLINDIKYRKLQSIETGEIYNPEWQ